MSPKINNETSNIGKIPFQKDDSSFSLIDKYLLAKIIRDIFAASLG
jgi:hypothetical protein